VEALDVFGRRACKTIDQPRSTQRYDKQIPAEEELPKQRIVKLTSQYVRYGYRRVTALLRNEG